MDFFQICDPLPVKTTPAFPQAILISAIASGQGKTSVTAALARTFGVAVLLVLAPSGSGTVVPQPNRYKKPE